METGDIFRDLTEAESKDFSNIMDPKNEDVELRVDIYTKISKRNRSILAKCQSYEEFMKAIKTLSCMGCYDLEARKFLAPEDFKESFEKYKGRLKMKNIGKHSHKNGLEYEKSFTIYMQPCSYCAKNQSFGFLKEELPENLTKELYIAAAKEEGEEV